ncbi:hypothetical protein HanIR_Chr05g0242711 [Helianthus annuus]|nr:hypothetical protein HanIR_Chr05g0242711 [Helianthus annuus]
MKATTTPQPPPPRPAFLPLFLPPAFSADESHHHTSPSPSPSKHLCSSGWSMVAVFSGRGK